ncbi:hypothetical protein JD969_07535 [Planctomycetota bacterium]|nr:hypothetical protein JD969_07535 [Planctomycetota bacterium]
MGKQSQHLLCFFTTALFVMLLSACTQSESKQELADQVQTETEIKQQAITEAKEDLANNHLALRSRGMRFSDHDIYVKLMKDKYNIHIEHEYYCLYSNNEVLSDDTYNAVMMEEIRKQYPEDIVKKTYEEAQAIYLEESGWVKALEELEQEQSDNPLDTSGDLH